MAFSGGCCLPCFAVRRPRPRDNLHVSSLVMHRVWPLIHSGAASYAAPAVAQRCAPPIDPNRQPSCGTGARTLDFARSLKRKPLFSLNPMGHPFVPIVETHSQRAGAGRGSRFYDGTGYHAPPDKRPIVRVTLVKRRVSSGGTMPSGRACRGVEGIGPPRMTPSTRSTNGRCRVTNAACRTTNEPRWFTDAKPARSVAMHERSP